MYGNKKKNYKRRPSPYTSKGKKRIVSKARRSNFKKNVKAIISSNSETKCFYSNLEMNGYGRIDSGATNSNFINITPQPISQGTGQGNRVGNSIKTKSFIFKGIVRSSGFYEAPEENYPVICTMLVLSLKSGISINSTSFPTGSYDDLIQLGNVNDYWVDDVVSHYRDLNKDMFNIEARRTFKLAPARYKDGATQDVTYNNDFKLVVPFKFNLTKAIGKIMRFDDSTATRRTGKQLFFTLVANHIDGSSAGSSITCQCIGSLNYKFTDP